MTNPLEGIGSVDSWQQEADSNPSDVKFIKSCCSRIAALEARAEALYEGRLPYREAEVAQARYEKAEAELAEFKSRHTAAGCGMDATTGSLTVRTTGVGTGFGLVNDVIPPDRVEDGER